MCGRGYFSEEKTKLQNYLDALKNVCVNGKFDPKTKICQCDTGYLWDNAANKCSSVSRMCKNQFGENSTWSLGKCVCNDGYQLNAKGVCSKISSPASSNQIKNSQKCPKQMGLNAIFDQKYGCICKVNSMPDSSQKCITLKNYVPSIGERICGINGEVGKNGLCVCKKGYHNGSGVCKKN